MPTDREREYYQLGFRDGLAEAKRAEIGANDKSRDFRNIEDCKKVQLHRGVGQRSNDLPHLERHIIRHDHPPPTIVSAPI